MFQVSFRPIALKEYESAIRWYAERSKIVSEKFIKTIEEKITRIAQNPKQYKNLYKNYFEVSTRKYPYGIVYTVDQKKKEIMLIAIYHHKRNPKKKYRK